MITQSDVFELPNRDLVHAKDAGPQHLGHRPHVYRAEPGSTYYWAYLLTASGRYCGGTKDVAQVHMGTAGAPNYRRDGIGRNVIEGGETVGEAITRLKAVGEDPWYLYVGQDQDAHSDEDSSCEYKNRNVRVYRLPR